MAELANLVDQGQATVGPERGIVNLHCHTFFSFNAYGHSPTSLAWLARRRGFAAVGIVDFDVLDGVDEFLAACDRIGVRGSAGIETRVYIPEFATRVINSPGEPGVCYHMGIGFASSRVPEEAGPALLSLRERATRRNRDMLARINAHLALLEIDYEEEVLPLTPSGNATERHMLAAITQAAEMRYPDTAARVGFWAAKLSMPAAEVATTIADTVKFSTLLRARLMKRGGPGYVPPTPESFPSLHEFHTLIETSGALPCAAWLDGLSAGEQAIDELLALLVGQRVAAINIIPDRNWNVTDSELRNRKVAQLHEIVRIARELELPINVGTEMNSPGNRIVDDFSVPPMAPLRAAFLAGAYFIYGHTVLQRTRGLGYQSDWARDALPGRKAKNVFFEAVGRRVSPGAAGLARCAGLRADMSPAELLAALD